MAATLKVDTIQNASSATANITLDTNGNATVGNTLAMGSSFLRNRIINGDMRIDQRNAGASVPITTSDNYTLDRWQGTASANSRYTVQQNAGSVTPPVGFTNYLGATSVSSGAPGSTDSYLISQFIEGLNVADIAWGTANAVTVTLSFWVRSSLTGSFGGTITNSAGNRSYPFPYTINAANTWEYKTITVPGDTSGTWLTTNGIGLRVRFSMGMGSSNLGTASTWAGSFVGAPTGSTNVIATNGATWYITGVQLEVGSVATPFERRQYTTEQQLCMRYCQVYGGTNLAGLAVGLYVSATEAQSMTPYLAPMRTTPSATVTNSTGAFEIRDGAGTVALSTVKTVLGVSSMLVYQDTGISGKTAGQALYFRSGSSTYGSIILSAEL